ncbi:MAG: helix-turn-helix transcriptional regulator [Bacteroidales bacterium]|nr:helix-turn-helix transcriptional regulator [Bacteroidales bacterium]
MKRVYDDLLQEELGKLSSEEIAESELKDAIASRIDELMKKAGVSRTELARRTGKRPSEVTRWLGGGHNFTCSTITLISRALGTNIIRVTGRKHQ